MQNLQPHYISQTHRLDHLATITPSSKLIDQLLAAQQVVEASPQYTDSSRRIYLSRLRQFVQYLAEKNMDPPVTEFQHRVCEFIDTCRTSLQWKTTTVNNFIRTFRAYARILHQPYVRTLETESDIRRSYLSTTDEIRLLETARARPSCRETLLCLLFLRTPIGLSDCTNIKLDDLQQTSEGQIQLTVRNRYREQTQTLSPDLATALKNWLSERDSTECSADSPYLFLGPKGDKLTTSAIDIMLRKTGWRAGLNLSTQTLRNARKIRK